MTEVGYSFPNVWDSFPGNLRSKPPSPSPLILRPCLEPTLRPETTRRLVYRQTSTRRSIPTERRDGVCEDFGKEWSVPKRLGRTSKCRDRNGSGKRDILTGNRERTSSSSTRKKFLHEVSVDEDEIYGEERRGHWDPCK